MADLDVIIKEMATIGMDYFVNFQPGLVQEVTGLKRDILGILERSMEQLTRLSPAQHSLNLKQKNI